MLARNFYRERFYCGCCSTVVQLLLDHKANRGHRRIQPDAAVPSRLECVRDHSLAVARPEQISRPRTKMAGCRYTMPPRKGMKPPYTLRHRTGTRPRLGCCSIVELTSRPRTNLVLRYCTALLRSRSNCCSTAELILRLRARKIGHRCTWLP